uniref:Uncharacterized protein n=1 Tax=Panagrolaimus sp. PS1159 TaxID=55785 RepID=A0AC35G9C5_9BILA
MYLYQKCGLTERPDYYATGIIEGAEKPLENTATENVYSTGIIEGAEKPLENNIGRICFTEQDPFQQYGSDATRSFMKLQVTPGNFGCQVFLILPNYMHVRDFDFKEPTTLS